jgi:hypothetical protein
LFDVYPSKGAFEFVASVELRNESFAANKPTQLAFFLATRARSLHLSHELIDVIVLQFLLSLHGTIQLPSQLDLAAGDGDDGDDDDEEDNDDNDNNDDDDEEDNDENEDNDNDDNDNDADVCLAA